jgi:hypothetical protein
MQKKEIHAQRMNAEEGNPCPGKDKMGTDEVDVIEPER